MSNARFSIIQARAVRDTRITPRQFRTLAALGVYGDEDGWCFPKLSTLSEMLGVSNPTVSKDISELVELGYIEKHPQYRADGGRANNRYRLIFDTPFPSQGEDGKGGFPEQGESGKGGFPEQGESGKALTSHINAPEERESPPVSDESGESIQDWFAKREKPMKRLEGGLSADEYRERIEGAMIRGAKRESRLRYRADLDGYPEDVKDVLKIVCGIWYLSPPTVKSERGYWIDGARQLTEACGEFGLYVITEFYQDEYLEMKDPFTVNSPRSLINSVRGYVAKRRSDKAVAAKRGSVEYVLEDGTTIDFIPEEEDYE
jgi:hypothetical protein